MQIYGCQKAARIRFFRNKSVWLCLSSTLLLTGCLQEQLDRWLHEETYRFHGTFDNEYNADTLQFKDGTVHILSKELRGLCLTKLMGHW